MKFWWKVQRCFHWVAGGAGAFRSGLNWVDVKTVANIENIDLSKPMLTRLRKAESLCVASDIKKMNDKG